MEDMNVPLSVLLTFLAAVVPVGLAVIGLLFRIFSRLTALEARTEAFVTFIHILLDRFVPGGPHGSAAGASARTGFPRLVPTARTGEEAA